MIVGFAAQDITPDPGLSMSGFGVRQGPPTAVGIHDPIHVHALAASAGGSTVILFSFDLIGLPVAWIDQARKAVENDCGVPAGSQMYSCSHTHCGPGTGVIPYTMGEAPIVDSAYMECLTGSVVNVARAALKSAASANLRIGEGKSYAGWNRRSADAAPNGPRDGHVDEIDPAVVVAQFEGGRRGDSGNGRQLRLPRDLQQGFLLFVRLSRLRSIDCRSRDRRSVYLCQWRRRRRQSPRSDVDPARIRSGRADRRPVRQRRCRRPRFP